MYGEISLFMHLPSFLLFIISCFASPSLFLARVTHQHHPNISITGLEGGVLYELPVCQRGWMAPNTYGEGAAREGKRKTGHGEEQHGQTSRRLQPVNHHMDSTSSRLFVLSAGNLDDS